MSYGANINVGAVKVTVTGIGAYTGNVTKTFKILTAKSEDTAYIGVRSGSFTIAASNVSNAMQVQ